LLKNGAFDGRRETTDRFAERAAKSKRAQPPERVPRALTGR
jgi:hypothetical protein